MDRYCNYIKPILFLCIFFGLLWIFSIIFVPKNNLGDFGMRNIAAHGFLAEKEDTIDVLFIGDSLAYASFFPLQLYEDYGITSFTIGTPAQKMYETYSFLETFLKTQNPKVVVFENGAMLREYPTDEAIRAEVSRYFPIVEYHNRWKNLTINDFNTKINYTYTDPTKGYKKIDNVVSGVENDYMKKNKKYQNISKENEMYLERMQKLCEEHDIEFMMVSTITMKSMNYARHNSFQRLSEEYDIPYIDLNLVQDIDIDWTNDSYDAGEHLNYYGALKIGDYIGPYLKETYNLEDHRGDSKYSSYEEALVNFNKKVE